MTELQFEDEPEEGPQHFDFFPDHLYTELIVGLVLMILLSVLATLFPATMGPQADPLTTPEVIKPEWFFYATFRWLKLFSATVRRAEHGIHRLHDVRLAVYRRLAVDGSPGSTKSASGSASSACFCWSA